MPHMQIISRGERRVTPEMPKTHLVLVPCGYQGCGHTTSGRREGDTLNSYAAHFVYAHLAGVDPQEAA